MKLFCKILFISILSLTFPVGKMVELFAWNNRIVKTETVVRNHQAGIRGRYCSFVKIAGQIFAETSERVKRNRKYTLCELVRNIRIRQTVSLQMKRFSVYKNRFDSQPVFNIVYSDDPEDQMILCA